ncbi:unnamed protein product [Nyctereutes procyonoides]|uniref:(raccoon dog) hypothetical protein n=1 Tax=Nyctereutes procyonoides TaxID=34880 RepID=A0A811YTE1_NYCPR|nr:unnamed protein product [Nyctereutes procyonoides]
MIKTIPIFNSHGKVRLSNFLEEGLLIGRYDNKLIYRHNATLYFVFCVDSSKSDLGILNQYSHRRSPRFMAPAHAVSAIKNMNLPEIPRDSNTGNISIKVPDLPSFK